MWAVYILLGAVGLFLAVLLLRAAFFLPGKQDYGQAEEIPFDPAPAVTALQKLVQCRTVSSNDPEEEDDGEFEKLIALLPTLYPRVFDVCSFNRLPDRGLLLRWPGRHDHAPAVMMAHYDVVPADEEKWDKPPFAGIIEDGVLWGRGTLDTKATLNGALSAANYLIAKGFRPEQDIYFAFSGGEEINGKGAENIADWFLRHDIHPALVLDEGGAVVENVFPGVKQPCGLIGIGEKGMMNVSYTLYAGGGHASAPPVKTTVGTLCEVCRRVEKTPFKMHITKPAAELFDTLGRHSSFGYKILFANLWCFRPVLDLFCRKKGGEMNALVRTTVAFTQMQGSNARNVLPTQASLVSNVRLNPGDTVQGAKAFLKKAVANHQVKVRVLEGFEPSPISETTGEAWEKVASSVAKTWPGCIVAPYLMVQCSDARHYGKLSSHVYRFCAMDMTGEERKTIHGNNERIRLEAIEKTVEFYIRLLRQC